ncbi:MAG: NAD-dependent epimerase/dehydratase family protein [Schleiferiaceae bacterium]|nr:NAD-dependent epimerase/dehydratase family protein [Schleiferiaceae bacterium]
MKIAITGHTGFIGRHLVNSLVYKSNFRQGDIVHIDKEDFKKPNFLRQKLSDCQTLIHLAGVNRHEDSDYIFEENIRLTKLLIDNISEKTKTIIFSSSIQQKLKNPFGEAKLKCSKLLNKWAIRNNKEFINLKIPNVFGPFCKPNYNSVVSTFCYNLIYKKKVIINESSDIKLLYIDDLIDTIISHLEKPIYKISEISKFNGTNTTTVSSVFRVLKNQWDLYNSNIIPNTSTKFELNLFNTLRSFIEHDKVFPKKLIKHNDKRGFFSEIIKTNGEGQSSISTTIPGITRGNHFHTRKIERFVVTQGKAVVELRKIGSNKKISVILEGSKLNFIDIPVWYTHNIRNIGTEILVTLFWINEAYDPQDSDTYFIEV